MGEQKLLRVKRTLALHLVEYEGDSGRHISLAAKTDEGFHTVVFRPAASDGEFTVEAWPIGEGPSQELQEATENV